MPRRQSRESGFARTRLKVNDEIFHETSAQTIFARVFDERPTSKLDLVEQLRTYLKDRVQRRLGDRASDDIEAAQELRVRSPLVNGNFL